MFQVAATILLTLTFVEQTEGALQSQKFGDSSLLGQPEDSYYNSGQRITNIAVWVYTDDLYYILALSGIQVTYGTTVASLHGSTVYGSIQLSPFQFQVPAGDVITQVDVGVSVSATGSNNYICYLQFHTKSTSSEIMSSSDCSMTASVSLSHGLAYIGYGVRAYNNIKDGVSYALGISALQFFYDDGLSTPTTANTTTTTSASVPQGGSSTTTSSSLSPSTDSSDYAKWIGIGVSLLAVVVSVIAIVARYKMSKKKSSKTPGKKADAGKNKPNGAKTNNKEGDTSDQQAAMTTSESTAKLVDVMDLDDVENPRVAVRKVSVAKQPTTLLTAKPVFVRPEQVVIQQQAPLTTAILVESAPPQPSIIQQAPPPAYLPTQQLLPNGPAVSTFSANMQPAQRVTWTSQPMTVRPQYHVTTTYPPPAAAGPTLVQYPAPSGVTMVKNVTPGLMTYHNFHS